MVDRVTTKGIPMDIRLLVRLTLGLVVSALGAWLVAVVLTLPSGSVAAIVVLRTLLALPVVLLVTRTLLRRTHESPQLLRTVVVAAVLSYVLWPAAWGGHGLVGQLLLDNLLLAYVVDLVIWSGTVLLAARSAEPLPREQPVRPYQSA